MIWVELDGGVCYELGDDSFLLLHLRILCFAHRVPASSTTSEVCKSRSGKSTDLRKDSQKQEQSWTLRMKDPRPWKSLHGC